MHGIAADNGLQPYVAFNAELRAAFQAAVNAMEERCSSLVRHQLDVATSAYSGPLSLAGLALDDADDIQNAPPPNQGGLHDRCLARGALIIFRRSAQTSIHPLPCTLQ